MKLLHLYYDLMNLYGEYGNVVVLKKHLEDQGETVTIDKKTIGDDISFDEYDFIYCGSGTESHKLLALEDLRKRSEDLRKAVNNDKVILFTGNAMEFMADLGFAEFTYTPTGDRFTGDVIVENDEIGKVVGFVNRCSHISVPKDIALFRLLLMFSDGKKDVTETEGYRVRNVFGTYIIGPVLTKNPGFMKTIVSLLLGGRAPVDVEYPFEEDSYQVTLKALSERK